MTAAEYKPAHGGRPDAHTADVHPSVRTLETLEAWGIRPGVVYHSTVTPPPEFVRFDELADHFKSGRQAGAIGLDYFDPDQPKGPE